MMAIMPVKNYEKSACSAIESIDVLDYWTLFIVPKSCFQQYAMWPFNRYYVNAYDSKHQPADVIALNLTEDVLKGFKNERGKRQTNAIIDALGSFEDSGSRGHGQRLDGVRCCSQNDSGTGSGLGKRESGVATSTGGILENDVKFSRSLLRGY
jgi:hypothetical protein